MVIIVMILFLIILYEFSYTVSHQPTVIICVVHDILVLYSESFIVQPTKSHPCSAPLPNVPSLRTM